ncbi:MAG: hypothetical protein LIR50_21295, partial [Bacillota bacterium]|nr:hypothetical protein [Bacillota bacterium]
IPLYTAIASSTLGSNLSELATYGKVTKVSTLKVANIISGIKEEINNYNQYINLLNKEKNSLKDFNNSISEKLEGLREFHREIEEINEDICRLTEAESILYFISNIAEELAEGDDRCALYIGYETGTNITPDDVV